MSLQTGSASIEAPSFGPHDGFSPVEFWNATPAVSG